MIWQTRTLATFIAVGIPMDPDSPNNLVDAAQRIGVRETMRRLSPEQRKGFAEDVVTQVRAETEETAAALNRQVPEPRLGSFENFMSTFGRASARASP